MVDLPQWDSKWTQPRLFGFLNRVTEPTSNEAMGERLAFAAALLTPEQVAEFLRDTGDPELKSAAMMVEAQNALRLRLHVVTTALDRLEAVEDVIQGGAHA